MILEAYNGNAQEIVVAFSEEGEAITQIGAKAFLSCKSIKKLEIAGSVTGIGDWAFAHMQNLEILILPGHELCLGKKVFLNCIRLMQIQVTGYESGNPGTPWFLASAVRVLQREELCKPEWAGSADKHMEWMQAYDSALLSFLEEADEEGFEPVFIGWFHVEDMDEQIPRYLKKRRKEKAQLVLQRLFYPDYLTEDRKERLYAYIRKHVTCEGNEKEHTAVFDLFCDPQEKYAQDVRYCKILKESGCLNDSLIRGLFDGIKNPSPEVTAYLLRQQAEGRQDEDFFSTFIL